jgi:tetratricopeptide (TPR) repeat protein
MKASQDTFSGYQVPESVKNLLMQAVDHWENTAIADEYINQALAKAEAYPDILVAAYRYFYYKQNNRMALQMAEKILATIKIAENLPDDWEKLKPILTIRRQEPEIRRYLNAYAATGFILAKMGEVQQAKAVTEKIQDIDSESEFGASIVLNILTR